MVPHKSTLIWNNLPIFVSVLSDEMMNNFIKTGFLLFLMSTGLMVSAQQVSYKNLSEELISLQKQLVTDKRVAILEIEIKDTLRPVITVSGETSLADAKQQIVSFLNNRKISFTDSIRVLPDAAAGEKTWALVTLSVSNLRAKPDDAAEMVSQVLLGTPLKILDYKNKWYRIQTPDQYIGWMDAAGLQPLSLIEFENLKNSKRVVFNRISGFVTDAPKKDAGIVSDVVLGDLFEVEATVKKYLKIRFPDGRTGFVRKTDCTSFEEWSNSETDIDALLSLARKMTGFPYLWGGTSTKGMDCSGFVKTVFYSQGIILARDASQQAKYGEAVDISNRNNLQTGDLLFFGRSAQRITHVGIYLGNGYFIHSSGKIHISSINPDDPKYVPERNFVAARRILNSIDKEGIVKVKDHEWYNK